MSLSKKYFITIVMLGNYIIYDLLLLFSAFFNKTLYFIHILGAPIFVSWLPYKFSKWMVASNHSFFSFPKKIKRKKDEMRVPYTKSFVGFRFNFVFCVCVSSCHEDSWRRLFLLLFWLVFARSERFLVMIFH